MSRILEVNNIMVHFKHEMDLPENLYKYMYRILAFAKHTETEETLVIYESINTGQVFARPYDMFISEVDREKYPRIEQHYRLEKFTDIKF